MKTFEFDQFGNMTVREESEGGADTREIQAAQIGRHLPMFEADMPADVLAQAKQIAGIE